MTVLSRGARVRRGGRRPGWVLLTALLALSLGASSALVFTDRVEFLKLAVVLALWAAIVGAFVSVFYRRQSDADQARVRDMKLVYDLQLDREISARREYELSVESQLRRELASELRAQSADEVAALRAELSALRTNLEILFDTDLEHRPALETPGKEAGTARAFSERAQESGPVGWVASDRITTVRSGGAGRRVDEVPIIDVPEEPLLPPRQHPIPVREPVREKIRLAAEVPPRHRPPPEPSDWQPVPAAERWLASPAPGRHWGAPMDAVDAPVVESSGRRRRARHSSPQERENAPLGGVEGGRHDAEPGRRSYSRHSVESRDHGPAGIATSSPAEPAPPPPEFVSRHRSAEPVVPEGSPAADQQAGGQSVADLMARLRVEPPAGGRRRRRDD